MSVVAVVVTYNRKSFLEECLDGLLAEGLVSKIILINNGSNDGTAQLVEDRYVNEARLQVINLKENTGGAGGFSLGLDLARKTDASWYWCMDDDVEPVPGCLKKMLDYSEISHCIHPQVQYKDGSFHEWEHLFDPNTTMQIGLRNQSFKGGQSWCSMRVACFEGMLIHKTVVEKIGLPHADFFIYSDDGHYGFMASQVTNVIYVRDAVLIKKIKPGSDVTPFRIYYDIRNRFLLRRKILSEIEVRWYSKWLFYIFLMFHSVAMVSYNSNFSKIRALWWAWHDGLKNISGKSTRI